MKPQHKQHIPYYIDYIGTEFYKRQNNPQK